MALVYPDPAAAEAPAADRATWAIVLAGGEGTRLRPLTARLGHESVPKQFWSLGRGRSLLRCAIERAARVAPRERILVVVAAGHREWWQPELRDLAPGNVIVQPEGRGTAAGILLPLLRVWRADPLATVVIVPSDHHVEREATFALALEQAVAFLRGAKDRLVLLGMSAEAAEPGYGWIVPDPDGGAVQGVLGFAEKPPLPAAEELRRRGALVNTFVFAARVDALMRLYDLHLPELAKAFRGALVDASRVDARVEWNLGELAALYRGLAPRDFSRDLLEAAVAQLAVLRVQSCGWSDLGTPERVAECLARAPRVAHAAGNRRPLDLARAFSRGGGRPAAQLAP